MILYECGRLIEDSVKCGSFFFILFFLEWADRKAWAASVRTMSVWTRKVRAKTTFRGFREAYFNRNDYLLILCLSPECSVIGSTKTDRRKLYRSPQVFSSRPSLRGQIPPTSSPTTFFIVRFCPSVWAMFSVSYASPPSIYSVALIVNIGLKAAVILWCLSFFFHSVLFFCSG